MRLSLLSTTELSLQRVLLLVTGSLAEVNDTIQIKRCDARGSPSNFDGEWPPDELFCLPVSVLDGVKAVGTLNK